MQKGLEIVFGAVLPILASVLFAIQKRDGLVYHLHKIESNSVTRERDLWNETEILTV